METSNNRSFLIINESDINKFSVVNENVVNDSQCKVFYSLFVLKNYITEEKKDGTRQFLSVNISAKIWKLVLNEKCLAAFKKIKDIEIKNDFKHVYQGIIIILISAGIAVLGAYLNTLTWGKSSSGNVGETWKFIIWKGGTLLLSGAGFVYCLFSIYFLFKTIFSYLLLLFSYQSKRTLSERKIKRITKFIFEFLFFQLKDNYPLLSKRDNEKTFINYSQIKSKYKDLYQIPEIFNIDYKSKHQDITIKNNYKYHLFHISADLNEIFKTIPFEIKTSKNNSKISICNGNENIMLSEDIVNILNKPTKR